MGFVLGESQYGEQTHTKVHVHTHTHACAHTHTHTHTHTSKSAHTCIFDPGLTLLWILIKVFHFKERCLNPWMWFSLALPICHPLSLCPCFSHTHTHTHTCILTHARAHAHINRASIGEGEQNPFSRHNFVWQEWQILFYDWMGFSTLLGTHSPIMQLATAITLPVRLAQRRCSV